MFLLRETNINWKKYAEHFNTDPSDLADDSMKMTEKVTKLSENFYTKQSFPNWWELKDILQRCCTYRPDDIQHVMISIHENNVNGKWIAG